MGLTVSGLEEVENMLALLQKRQRTLQPFLDDEAALLRAEVDSAWASRRSPDGTPWPRYKDGERTGGRLRGAEHIKASRSRLELRATHIARFHYFGTEFLPARNPLPFVSVATQDGALLPLDSWADRHGQRLKEYILGRPDENSAGSVGGNGGR